MAIIKNVGDALKRVITKNVAMVNKINAHTTAIALKANQTDLDTTNTAVAANTTAIAAIHIPTVHTIKIDTFDDPIFNSWVPAGETAADLFPRIMSISATHIKNASPITLSGILQLPIQYAVIYERDYIYVKSSGIIEAVKSAGNIWEQLTITYLK